MHISIALIILNLAAISYLIIKFRPIKTYGKKCGDRMFVRNGKFKVRALGKTMVYSPGRTDIEYCPACLAKMVIQCIWCKKPIFPGNPISVFTAVGKHKIPDQAYILTGKPLQAISCADPGCLKKFNGEINGIWVAPGKVGEIFSPQRYSGRIRADFIRRQIAHCVKIIKRPV
ncbi:hypothetical protein HZA71_00475 [Candidatus Falkowbacteria bacterium]|nr:hypothetical protein [Candidatus Falkowbacteria bacterium]